MYSNRLISLCAFPVILKNPDGLCVPPFVTPAPLAISPRYGETTMLAIVPGGESQTIPVTQYAFPIEIRDWPEIPEWATGIVMPLALAEAMRRLGRKVQPGVDVFTLAPTRKDFNKDGAEVTYAPYLLRHPDLTEGRA